MKIYNLFRPGIHGKHMNQSMFQIQSEIWVRVRHKKYYVTESLGFFKYAKFLSLVSEVICISFYEFRKVEVKLRKAFILYYYYQVCIGEVHMYKPTVLTLIRKSLLDTLTATMKIGKLSLSLSIYFLHSIYFRRVSSCHMLSGLLKQLELVRELLGQSNMHHTFDFCPDQSGSLLS